MRDSQEENFVPSDFGDGLPDGEIHVMKKSSVLPRFLLLISFTAMTALLLYWGFRDGFDLKLIVYLCLLILFCGLMLFAVLDHFLRSVSYDSNKIYIKGWRKEQEISFKDILRIERKWSVIHARHGKSYICCWSLFTVDADHNEQVKVSFPQGKYGMLDDETRKFLAVVKRRNPNVTTDIQPHPKYGM